MSTMSGLGREEKGPGLNSEVHRFVAQWLSAARYLLQNRDSGGTFVELMMLTEEALDNMAWVNWTAAQHDEMQDTLAWMKTDMDGVYVNEETMADAPQFEERIGGLAECIQRVDDYLSMWSLTWLYPDKRFGIWERMDGVMSLQQTSPCCIRVGPSGCVKCCSRPKPRAVD